MTRVLLFHSKNIPHYRVPIYNFFSKKFKEDGINFIVASESVQFACSTSAEFSYLKTMDSLVEWLKVIRQIKPQVVIIFSGLRNFYIFPFIYILRAMRIKTIYWGHGINLSKKESLRPIYRFLHRLCDGIILYADHLKQYVDKNLWGKISIAPNTLCLSELPEEPTSEERYGILSKCGIKTDKNIIFVGRIQKRKRILDLIQAYEIINRQDIGVVIVGPDVDGGLPAVLPDGVFHIPGMYGKDLYQLMMICNVCCCPGSVGLNIVDAMACGLPIVTEAVDHGPEIMYLKREENGAVVSLGDVEALSKILLSIIDDVDLHKRMSSQARITYEQDASIDSMYKGFHEAILKQINA